MSRRPGLDFSFSGLKTALVYVVRDLEPGEMEARRGDLAASFQAAVVSQLVAKARPRPRRRRPGSPWPSAAGSRRTRSCASGSPALCEERGVRLKLVAPELCTDNAAMIGSAASHLAAGRLPRLSRLGRRRAVSAATDRPVVTLFGRPGCHLCDEARAGLLEMRRSGAGFELVEVDIESDENLHRSMLELIPVIDVDGDRVCELFLDQDAILGRLGTLSA